MAAFVPGQVVGLDEIASSGRSLLKWLRDKVPTWTKCWFDFDIEQIFHDTHYPVPYPDLHPWKTVFGQAIVRIDAFSDLVSRGSWCDDDDEILKEKLLGIANGTHCILDPGRSSLPALPVGIHCESLDALEATIEEAERVDASMQAACDEADAEREEEQAPEPVDEQAPYTSADLAWLLAMSTCPVDAPTEAECLAHQLETTLSFDEFDAGKNVIVTPLPPKAEMIVITPEVGGNPPVFYGFGDTYSGLDGGEYRLSRYHCRKLESVGPDGESRTLYLTPENRWIVQIGEDTEEYAPSFHEIPARNALPESSHIAVSDSHAFVKTEAMTDRSRQGNSNSMRKRVDPKPAPPKKSGRGDGLKTAQVKAFIIKDEALGMTNVAIARKFKCSEALVCRHRKPKKDEKEKMISDALADCQRGDWRERA